MSTRIISSYLLISLEHYRTRRSQSDVPCGVPLLSQHEAWLSYHRLSIENDKDSKLVLTSRIQFSYAHFFISILFMTCQRREEVSLGHGKSQLILHWKVNILWFRSTSTAEKARTSTNLNVYWSTITILMHIPNVIILVVQRVGSRQRIRYQTLHSQAFGLLRVWKREGGIQGRCSVTPRCAFSSMFNY